MHVKILSQRGHRLFKVNRSSYVLWELLCLLGRTFLLFDIPYLRCFAKSAPLPSVWRLPGGSPPVDGTPVRLSICSVSDLRPPDCEVNLSHSLIE